MSALITSNIVLWLIVVMLALMVFALTRQIGILHQRISPVGALMIDKGPAVGDIAPVIELEDINGEIHLLGSQQMKKDQLLFFMSPDCPVCKSLFPALKSINKNEFQLEVILISDGASQDQHLSLIKTHHLSEFRYFLSAEIGMRYQIGKLPYGVLLTAGTIVAKGLCNSREHIESLLHAKEQGVGSVQEFVAQNKLAVVTRPDINERYS